MSEYSESYHLRSKRKADAVRLLTRAGVAGLVFPPARGWVPILAQGEPFVLNPKLFSANEGPLLYYMSAEDHGWSFAACQADRLVSQYGCNWDPELMIHDSQLRLTDLSAWLRDIGVKEPKPEMLEHILRPQKEDLKFDDLPSYDFAELLGLTQYRWSSFDYMLQEFDPDQPEFKGVVAVEAGVPIAASLEPGWSGYDPPAEKTEPPLMLPVLLHGDALTTKKNWRKITTRAWKQGSWDGIFAELEMRPVEALPGGICFQDSQVTPASLACWRLYWVADLLKDAAWKEGGPRRVEAIERFDSLMFAGMNELWFTMGSLKSNGGMMHMDVSTRRGSPRDITLAYIDRFIYWLPNMEAYWNWFRDETGSNGGIRAPFRSIIGLVYTVGRWLRADLASGNSPGRLLDAMIAANLVQLEGNRYRLKAPSVQELADSLRSEVPSVRQAAAHGLGSFGDAASVAAPKLAELLDDVDENVRIEAAEALGCIGPRAAPAIPALVGMLRARRGLCHAAACALGRMGVAAREAIPALIELLDDPQDGNSAATALGMLGPSAIEAVPSLRRHVERGLYPAFAQRAILQILGTE